MTRPTNFELTVEFHRAIRQLPEHQRPGPAARRAMIQLREQLIREEAKEAIEALEALRHADTPTRPDVVEHVAKELADVLCVAYGAAAALGIPMDEVYREVHASNMTKVGGPVRADGNMLKGDGYRAPDLARILKSDRRARCTHGTDQCANSSVDRPAWAYCHSPALLCD